MPQQTAVLEQRASKQPKTTTVGCLPLCFVVCVVLLASVVFCLYVLASHICLRLPSNAATSNPSLKATCNRPDRSVDDDEVQGPDLTEPKTAKTPSSLNRVIAATATAAPRTTTTNDNDSSGSGSNNNTTNNNNVLALGSGAWLKCVEG